MCANTYLKTLDLRNQKSIESINCSYNYSQEKLILPATESLLSLNCGSCSLKELLLGDCPNLQELNCSNNLLTMLDLSANTQLTQDKTLIQQRWRQWKMNLYTTPDSRYALALHGEDKCFKASRFSNLNAGGNSVNIEISNGYLIVPSFDYSSKGINYLFDTGNSTIGAMQVSGMCLKQGELQAVSVVNIYNYEWPQDFVPASYEASVDEPARLLSVGYVMFNKEFRNYDPYYGDNVGITFTITLDDGWMFATGPHALIDGIASDFTIKNNDTRTRQFCFNYTVPVPEGGIYIRSVNYQIDVPVAGQHPSYPPAGAKGPAQAKPQNHYSVGTPIWYRVVADEEEYEGDDFVVRMTPDDFFRYGFYYNIVLPLYPDEGYQFSERTIFYLNGSASYETAVTPNLKEYSDGFFNDDGPAAIAGFTDLSSLPTSVLEMPASPTPGTPQPDDAWYTIDGRKLSDKPTQKGIYISRGRKVVVR